MESRLNGVLSWSAVLIWIVIVLILMLSPGEDSIVEDSSGAFGGTDITDAIGHVILFTIWAFLLNNALLPHFPVLRAFQLTLILIFTSGTVLEFAQYFVPHRGVALLDLSANWLGGLLFIVHQNKKRS